jgi:hypothetical protein
VKLRAHASVANQNSVLRPFLKPLHIRCSSRVVAAWKAEKASLPPKKKIGGMIADNGRRIKDAKWAVRHKKRSGAPKCATSEKK